MSRGYGRMQRLVLEAVQRFGPIYLAALTTDFTTQYKSIHRAAEKLEAAGKVEFAMYAFGRHKLVVGEPGSKVTDRKDLDAKTPAVREWAQQRQTSAPTGTLRV